MKLKVLLFTFLLLGFAGTQAKSGYICVTEGKGYFSFYGIIEDYPYGSDMAFLEFCYNAAVKDNVFSMGKDKYVDARMYLPNIAAKFNRLDFVKFFIDKGFRADDNTLSPTPLHFASMHGNYKMADYMLNQSPKKANPTKTFFDKLGKYDKASDATTRSKNALDYAKQSGVQSVVSLVSNAMAKWGQTAELRRQEYKNQIKSTNLNDYEQFKLNHNLGKFNMNSYWGSNRA